MVKDEQNQLLFASRIMTVAAFLPTCPLLLASAEIGARALSHPPSVVPRLLLQPPAPRGFGRDGAREKISDALLLGLVLGGRREKAGIARLPVVAVAAAAAAEMDPPSRL